MFDIDQLIADCQGARTESEPRLAVRYLLQRELARPEAIASALGPA